MVFGSFSVRVFVLAPSSVASDHICPPVMANPLAVSTLPQIWR
jgi:hypothetical protein